MRECEKDCTLCACVFLKKALSAGMLDSWKAWAQAHPSIPPVLLHLSCREALVTTKKR